MGRMLLMIVLGPVAWLFCYAAVPFAAFLAGFRYGQSYYPNADERWIAACFGCAAMAVSLAISFFLFRLYDRLRADLVGDFGSLRRGAREPLERCEGCGRPVDGYDFACRHCGHLTQLARTRGKAS